MGEKVPVRSVTSVCFEKGGGCFWRDIWHGGGLGRVLLDERVRHGEGELAAGSSERGSDSDDQRRLWDEQLTDRQHGALGGTSRT